MRGDVLGGLDLAQQFGSVTADAQVVDFGDLDLAFRIDDEGAAQCQTFRFDHHVEVTGDGAGRVAEHDVLDLPDRVGSVGPGLVREVGVGRDRIDFDAQLLEFGVQIGHVAEFGRADEGEVGRVEEEDRPLALQVGIGHGDELAVLVGLDDERLELAVDDGHVFLLSGLGDWLRRNES
ncbi:hypothetical protein SDC9_126965 [bioreactor metagenome]|uniref:Uncharacterized protein n=1 Tax=bioreactor metagenome TaxID=1076179 RepID=A0A645CT95_9ZZZZ